MSRNTLKRNSLGLLAGCTLLLGSVLSACSPASDAAPEAQTQSALAVQPQREAQAARSLSALSHVVSAENFQRLGFHSVAEVTEAEGGTPASVYMVRLDQLRDFRRGEDPRQLLTDLETAIVPVHAHGEVHSSMELHKRAGNWETRSYGSPAHAKILDQVRRLAASKTGVAEEAFFEVRVLALNTYFLGHQGPGGLMLTPMLDDAELGLVAGQSRPAAEVFTLLQPRALAHNGQAT